MLLSLGRIFIFLATRSNTVRVCVCYISFWLGRETLLAQQTGVATISSENAVLNAIKLLFHSFFFGIGT